MGRRLTPRGQRRPGRQELQSGLMLLDIVARLFRSCRQGGDLRHVHLKIVLVLGLSVTTSILSLATWGGGGCSSDSVTPPMMVMEPPADPPDDPPLPRLAI